MTGTIADTMTNPWYGIMSVLANGAMFLFILLLAVVAGIFIFRFFEILFRFFKIPFGIFFRINETKDTDKGNGKKIRIGQKGG